jgi:hypothetical protein
MNAQSHTVQFRLVFDLIPYLSFDQIFEIRFLLKLARLKVHTLKRGNSKRTFPPHFINEHLFALFFLSFALRALVPSSIVFLTYAG